jgi:protein involved in polysaccharide export with SLBB domain
MTRLLVCSFFFAGLIAVCLIFAPHPWSQESRKPAIVYVVGAVRIPTGVNIESGAELTVLKAIALAGGTNPDANLNANLIRKTADGKQVYILLRLKDMLAGKAPDVHLQAQDIVWVPSNGGKLRVVPSVYQDAPLYKGAPAPLQEPQDP